MNPLLQRWWGNAGCRGGRCARPFLVCHVMIAPEGAPTEVAGKAGCRSGFHQRCGGEEGLVPALFLVVTP